MKLIPAEPPTNPPRAGDQRDITALLVAWSNGDEGALAELMPEIYEELRGLAVAYMRQERASHTLQATALVHEAYLRLIDQHRISWRCRSHFFGIASQMMRRILTDHARRGLAARRGSGLRPLQLTEVVSLGREPRNLEVLAIDQALVALAAIDRQKAKIVELRFFGGLDIPEIAEFLEVSQSTVARQWRVARAWLFRRLQQEHA